MIDRINKSATIFSDTKTGETEKIKWYEKKGYVVDESSLINRKTGDGIVMILKEKSHDS